jgi:hypothetical protein
MKTIRSSKELSYNIVYYALGKKVSYRTGIPGRRSTTTYYRRTFVFMKGESRPSASCIQSVTQLYSQIRWARGTLRFGSEVVRLSPGSTFSYKGVPFGKI